MQCQAAFTAYEAKDMTYNHCSAVLGCCCQQELPSGVLCINEAGCINEEKQERLHACMKSLQGIGPLISG